METNTNITFEQVPTLIGQLLTTVERIEARQLILLEPVKQLPKFVAMKEAAAITSKTANALRVQISLGNLKSIKKGNRHYFEREYLERWIAGDCDESQVIAR